jgi:hypothetical protein
MVSDSGSAMAKTKKRKTKIGHGPETTAAYKKRFLEKLAAGNAPSIAAKLANISRPTIYNWKRDDQEFSAAWENAVEAGVDKVETALVKRAIKNSDAAAIAYLKAYRPERYARKDTAEPRTNVTLQITLQEHNKRLERLGLPVPQIEGDYEEDASGPADANRS